MAGYLTKLRYHLWWRFMPRSSVVLPWPVGWTETDENGMSMESSDPNDHWRPWLDANAGRQGWDWDWRIAHLIGGWDENYGSHVEVSFRKGKEDARMAFALRWMR